MHRHHFARIGASIRIQGDVDGEGAGNLAVGIGSGEIEQVVAGLACLQAADAIYINGLKTHGLYDKVWQAGTILLPVKSVGVMGDERTYEQVVALRAVTSTDGMTADIYPFDAAFLSRVATRIINEVKGINRVVYDYTSKPPGTIEWE